ncbi:DUF7010 family protein [Brevundimonas bacteroides]|uniref:DUF7010 family protein n=1 Tax=Brevundimonas bacteroides TaxID=74311 RepID=UPI0012EE5392|nr:hypothetical protein [Brevundimonas bacteroides]
MDISAAQRDMARVHVRGAPGVLVSGLVWLIAGWLWLNQGVANGFYALFVGGMLIFPLSLLLSRAVFRAPARTKGNPLERLALESTFILFAGILLAWSFLRVSPELSFPAMAVAIGVRYFVFRTIYGSVVYWFLGGVIALLGAAMALTTLELPVNLALVVGAIEVVVSLVLFLSGRGDRPDPA